MVCPLNTASVLRSLVDVALPAWHPTRALYLGVDIRFHTEDHEPLTSGSAHILINKHSNYVTVWVAQDDDVFPRWNRISPEEWGPHAIHHDCWNSEAEGIITRTYFDLADKANSLLGKDIAPSKMNQFHTIRSELLDIVYESRGQGFERRYHVTDIRKFRPENVSPYPW